MSHNTPSIGESEADPLGHDVLTLSHGEPLPSWQGEVSRQVQPPDIVQVPLAQAIRPQRVPPMDQHCVGFGLVDTDGLPPTTARRAESLSFDAVDTYGWF